MRPTVTPVKIVLDKERTLLWDFNAQAAYEDATGENTLLQEFFEKNANAKRLKTLLWACLIHEDEKLTQKQVGAMLTVKKGKEALKAVFDAIRAAAVDPTDADEEPDPNADLPTG